MFIAMDNNQKRWNCMEEIPAVTEGPSIAWLVIVQCV